MTYAISRGRIRKKFIAVVLNLVMLIIPVTSVATNFKRTDLSQVFIGDDLAKNILQNLPKNSILLLNNDSTVFNAIYYQIAYNFRKDVYIPGRHNGLEIVLKSGGMSDGEIVEYKTKHKNAIEKPYFYQIIAKIISEGRLFSDKQLSLNITDQEFGDVISIPYGLVNKLDFEKRYEVDKETYLKNLNANIKEFDLDSFKRHEEVLDYSLMLTDVKGIYAISYYKMSKFIAEKFHDTKAAGELFRIGMSLDPIMEIGN